MVMKNTGINTYSNTILFLFFFLEGWLKVNRTIEIFFLSFIVFQDIETRTTNELVEL